MAALDLISNFRGNGVGHSGALDGLRESSSAVLDFRLLGEGLEGKDFFFTK